MNLQVKQQISSAAQDVQRDAASGMIIELEGAVLEQIAGGETGSEPENVGWTV